MDGESTKAHRVDDVVFRKLILIFAGVYIFGMILFLIVQSLLDIDLNSTDSIVSVMIAAMMAGSSMTTHLGHAPEKKDRGKLQIGCLIVLLAIDFLMTFAAVVLLSSTGDETLVYVIASLPVLLTIGALLFSALLHYVVIVGGVRLGISAALKKLPETTDKVPETLS